MRAPSVDQLSLNFFSSFFHGSQLPPYFFNNPSNSSFCSFYKIRNHTLAAIQRIPNESGRTRFQGCSPPYTSSNSSLSGHLFAASAFLNAFITSCFSFSFSSSSSTSDHQPCECKKRRKRAIGLSMRLRSSTSWRGRYAKESSEVE